MVVKVYVSGISGNKEVKKRQQRVLLILDSKNVKYELLDIAEPNMEEAKEYMQNNSKLNGGTISDPNPRHPLPPQIFNDDEYCGDYDAFDMANEIDEMEKFLKLAPEDVAPTSVQVKVGNGEVPNSGESKEASPEKEESNVEETETELKENGKGEENVPEAHEETQEEKSIETKNEVSPETKAETPFEQRDEESGGNKKNDNETDDQKVENAENSSREAEEAVKESEETEKSEEA